MTRGVAVKLYEAGETVAAHVRDWSHVRLFSPWRFNTDAAATAILRERGWQAPRPTHCRRAMIFMRPISSRSPQRLRCRASSKPARASAMSRATASTRWSATTGRSIRSRSQSMTADGRSRIDLARAVIDASGTWSSPNPASASGTPAIGEVAARGPYRIWDSRCAAARPRRLRGPACAGYRGRAFGRERAARPRTPRRNGRAAANQLGGPRRQSRARIRRRRGGQVPRARQARR